MEKNLFFRKFFCTNTLKSLTIVKPVCGMSLHVYNTIYVGHLLNVIYFHRIWIMLDIKEAHKSDFKGNRNQHPPLWHILCVCVFCSVLVDRQKRMPTYCTIFAIECVRDRKALYIENMKTWRRKKQESEEKQVSFFYFFQKEYCTTMILLSDNWYTCIKYIVQEYREGFL